MHNLNPKIDTGRYNDEINWRIVNYINPCFTYRRIYFIINNPGFHNLVAREADSLKIYDNFSPVIPMSQNIAYFFAVILGTRGQVRANKTSRCSRSRTLTTITCFIFLSSDKFAQFHVFLYVRLYITGMQLTPDFKTIFFNC